MLSLLANAGTPLMWFGLIYPFVASFGVALVEERILLWGWKVAPPSNRWRPLLLANLLTTAIGLVLINFAGAWGQAFLGARPLERVTEFVNLVWLAAFLLTLLGEAPFYAWALKAPFLSLRSWSANLACNVATYAALLGIVTVLSNNHLLREVQVVQLKPDSAQAGGWVYYVAPSNSVRRIQLDGTGDEATAWRVQGKDGVSAESKDCHSAALVSFGGATRTLCDPLGKAGQTASFRFQGNDDCTWPPNTDRELDTYSPSRTFVRPTSGNAPLAGFRSRNMYWPDLGMTFYDRAGNRSFQIAVGTPFVSWSWRSATALPDGRVVAEFGPQIVVVDIHRRTIDWLANGRSPTVLLDKPVW